MQDVANVTVDSPARTLYEDNQTTAALSALPIAAVATEPSGDGYFGNNPNVANHIVLGFFGAGSDNDTFNARVIGVKKTIDVHFANRTRRNDMWTFTPLFTVVGQLGNAVGLSGGIYLDTDRFADTLTVSSDTNVIKAPTATIVDGWAHLLFDMKGFSDLKVELDIDGGGAGKATNINVACWTI